MQKRFFTVFACILTVSLASFAASSKKAANKASAGPGPDKAYLVKLLDGWNTLNPANMAQYYASGDYTFFDIAPLKYNNWAEYQKGVTDLLKGYKSFKLTLNDDAQVHQAGDIVWTSATVKEEAVTSAGKHEMATLRWTVIFQKLDGKWFIVHEHTSEPVQ
jgi:ketosteroid isomerase-like protein